MTALTEPVIIRCTHCFNLGHLAGYFPNSNRKYCMSCASKHSWFPFVKANHAVPKAKKEQNLTDIRETVFEFIQANPRMPRQKIVETLIKQTDCSASKIQRIIKDYEAKGIINKVRRGVTWEEVIDNLPKNCILTFNDIRQLFPEINHSTLRNALYTLEELGRIKFSRVRRKVFIEVV